MQLHTCIRVCSSPTVVYVQKRTLNRQLNNWQKVPSVLTIQVQVILYIFVAFMTSACPNIGSELYCLGYNLMTSIDTAYPVMVNAIPCQEIALPMKGLCTSAQPAVLSDLPSVPVFALNINCPNSRTLQHIMNLMEQFCQDLQVITLYQ